MPGVCKIISPDKIDREKTRLFYTDRGDKILLGVIKGTNAETPLAIEFSDAVNAKDSAQICRNFSGEYFEKFAASVTGEFNLETGEKISVEEFGKLINSAFSVKEEEEKEETIRCGIKWPLEFSGPTYRVCIVKAGETLRSIEGKLTSFSEQVLRESAPLFEKKPLRVFKTDKGFFDHLQNIDPALALEFGASLDAEVGELRNVTYDEQEKGLFADAVLNLATRLGGFIDGQLKIALSVLGDLSKFLGLSLVAHVFVNSNADIVRMSHVEGVDVVSIPAAGGKWLKLIESIKEASMRDKIKKLILKFSSAKTEEELNKMSEEELFLLLESVVPKEDPAKLEGIAAKLTEVKQYDDSELKTALAGLRAELNVQAEERKRNMMILSAKEKINGTTLPDVSKTKLVKLLESVTSLESKVVDDLIAEETKTVDALKKDNGFEGLGFSIKAGADAKDKYRDALAVSFGLTDVDEKQVGRVGLKEFYIGMTGDYMLKKEFKMGFAAISSSEFSNVLGNVLNRLLLQAFGEMDYSEKALISQVRNAVDFRPINPVNVGGFGIFPTVTELQAYQEVAHPTDWKTTYSVLKKGGLLPISWETIVNDDVGLIQRLIMNFGRAARRTHGAYVFNLMTSNPTMYDALACFEAGTHTNLVSTAFDRAPLLAARIAMGKQTEPTSSFKIGLRPLHLWIPVDLENSAYSINQSEVVDSAFQFSVLKWMFGEKNERIHTVPFFTDATDYYMSGDPRLCDIIEMGYLNGNQQPELWAQNNPLQDSVFTDDKITYKIRFVFGGAMVEWRNVYAAVVAG